jgi:hypothetical protein
MGYSIRTTEFLYAEWPLYDLENYKPIWDDVLAYELYDLRVDPAEDFNVFGNSDYANVVSNLSARLHAANP